MISIKYLIAISFQISTTGDIYDHEIIVENMQNKSDF